MFSSVPQRLKARLLPTTTQSPKTLPEKSSVFIYDGAEDGESTSEEFKKLCPDGKIFGFDKCRSDDRDLLANDSDSLYNKLVLSAIAGNIDVIAGGPNCKSWSVLLLKKQKLCQRDVGLEIIHGGR